MVSNDDRVWRTDDRVWRTGTENTMAALLKITGKSVRKVSETPVDGLAEGLAFSPDGRFLYVGNFIEGNIDILRLDGDRLAKVATFPLPGHPASMRGNTP